MLPSTGTAVELVLASRTPASFIWIFRCQASLTDTDHALLTDWILFLASAALTASMSTYSYMYWTVVETGCSNGQQ